MATSSGSLGADPIGSLPIGGSATFTVFADAGCGCEPSLAARSGNERRRTIWWMTLAMMIASSATIWRT